MEDHWQRGFKIVREVGFIGLGDIGLPMAKRVVGGGYEVNVCGHVRRAPIEEMKSVGAKEVANSKEVAQASEVTIIMVQNDKQAEEVIFGHNGLLEGAKEGDGILLTGTFAPAFCKKVDLPPEKESSYMLDWKIIKGAIDGQKVLHT